MLEFIEESESMDGKCSLTEHWIYGRDGLPALSSLPFHLYGPVLYGFTLPKAHIRLPWDCDEILLHCPRCTKLKKDNNHDKECPANNRRCYACKKYGHVADVCPNPKKKLVRKERQELVDKAYLNLLPSEEEYKRDFYISHKWWPFKLYKGINQLYVRKNFLDS